METCSVCLEEIKENQILKTLSCGHKYHFNCFKKMVYHNNNFYIKCPMCREVNHNIEKPFINDNKLNILSMCHMGVGKLKCNGYTLKGERCKNKSTLMNYGKCHIHNKNMLKKEDYRLFSDYLYHILCSNYRWKTKIYLIDVGKKIIDKFLNDKSEVHEILQYYYRYLNDEDFHINEEFYMNGIYEYYNLEKASKNWVDYCINKNVII